MTVPSGEPPAPDPSAESGEPSAGRALFEPLDIGAMLKASQAVSSEIVLDRLIETLMRIVLEHAGAERGVLILLRNGQIQIAADARSNRNRVEVAIRERMVSRSDLPESVLHYVIRMRASLLLDDANVAALFAGDPYVQASHPKAVLCIPIIKQAKLVGALYLENSLTPRVFTPERITVLEFLASQAAISLENAYLYADLKRSEAFLAEGQRMSRTGSWSWNMASGRATWSHEHFRILGYDPGVRPHFDLFWGRVHPEDRPRLQQTIDEAVGDRRGFAFDFRIVLDDGSIKHLHGVGQPLFDASGEVQNYVGTTMDVTERKRAEEALRDAQAELAHVARLTTMGELAASIAHEVNQPLAAIVTNAETSLRWLDREEPDIDRVRTLTERIIRDGHNAGEVIRSIRQMMRKSARNVAPLDINALIQDVLDVMRGELRRQEVTLEIELYDELAPVSGDRVQLQQVIVNLLKNGIEALSSITQRPRLIRLATSLDANRNLLISVEDAGTGIDEAASSQLFEPFYTTKRDGMGMGLAICRSIVEAHGGRLWATPRQPHGSVFQFTLPAG